MSIKILIAEDSETNRLLFSMTMRKCGYEVDIAANGQEALQLFEKYRYDLVFLDLNMPVMDGVETARRISRRNPKGVPVYAISGFVDAEREAWFNEVGIRRCLIKPLTREMLAGIISECGFVLESPALGTADFLPPKPVPQQLLKVYARELKSRAAACERLSHEQNKKALYREAHTIRALAQMLEITPLADIAQRLENLCHGVHDPEVIKALALRLAEVCRISSQGMEEKIAASG